jgi:hypothetical protein
MKGLRRSDSAQSTFLAPTQLGYHVVQTGGTERVEPVNERLQIIFERTLWRFRQR